MSLTEWLNQGKLVRQRSSPREIADIFSVVERDLADSQVPGLSNDSQLISAYKAALQLAKAALAASGYRTRG